MSADEFLFRVEDMATSDRIHFDDMCSSMHVLLASRAEEWYWGYRRKQRNATWAQFRNAFIKKFAARQTDAEILSQISQRVQRPGERFDDFCRAVEAMAHRLKNQLQEYNLLQVLKANADLQLRRVLNLHDIRTVEQLQDTCLEYEDLWIRQGSWKRANRFISELGNSHELEMVNQHPVSISHQIEFQPTIDALQSSRSSVIACWNCDEGGHTYQDCIVATRNIFCYGCGAKNVYRPQCKRCSVNSTRRGVNGLPNSANMTQMVQNAKENHQMNRRPRENNQPENVQSQGYVQNWRQNI